MSNSSCVVNSEEHINNSQRFLNIFNKIEHYLRELTQSPKEISFYALIGKATLKSNSISYYSDDLKEFADLRNAIVHESSDGHVIAEPHLKTVERIETIYTNLFSPPKLTKLIKNKVISLQTSQPISNAVKLMFENSFSQLPICTEDRIVALLTADTITRWLGACVAEDLFSVNETLIEKVLNYTENKDNYCFLNKQSDVFSALSKFQEHNINGKRLDAILVTDSGKKTESLLGIVTIWDMPRIYEKINV